MAINKKITVDQGSNHIEHVDIHDSAGNPVDLVAGPFTSRLQVKRSYKDTAPIVLEFTTENGGLVLHANSVTGRISLVVTNTQTDNLTISGKILDCVYDWELIDGTGYVRRIYEGDFIISKNITI